MSIVQDATRESKLRLLMIYAAIYPEKFEGEKGLKMMQVGLFVIFTNRIAISVPFWGQLVNLLLLFIFQINLHRCLIKSTFIVCSIITLFWAIYRVHIYSIVFALQKPMCILFSAFSPMLHGFLGCCWMGLCLEFDLSNLHISGSGNITI